MSRDERRLRLYSDYLVKWDEHESRISNYFEKQDIEKYGSLERAEEKKMEMLGLNFGHFSPTSVNSVTNSLEHNSMQNTFTTLLDTKES